MRFNKPLALTTSLLLGTLAISPAQATNCSLSYYCYRSMVPGAAPVEPVAQPRPSINTPVGARIVTRPNTPNPVAVQQAGTRLPTPQQLGQQRLQQQAEQQRLAQQRRAQQQADQQRQAAQRREQQALQQARMTQRPSATPTRTQTQVIPAAVTERQTTPPALQPASRQASQVNTVRTSTAVTTQTRRTPQPAVLPAVRSNQSCSTLASKIKEAERQATLHAINKEAGKSQQLFKIAADLRSEAKGQSCSI